MPNKFLQGTSLIAAPLNCNVMLSNKENTIKNSTDSGIPWPLWGQRPLEPRLRGFSPGRQAGPGQGF